MGESSFSLSRCRELWHARHSVENGKTATKPAGRRGAPTGGKSGIVHAGRGFATPRDGARRTFEQLTARRRCATIDFRPHAGDDGMAEDKHGLHIDLDWKKQAQEEKRKLEEEE